MFAPFLLCNHLDDEQRACCVAQCCVALPRDSTGCLQFVILVFPDLTHYFFEALILMEILHEVYVNSVNTQAQN